jgi:hypothetical protein
MSTVPTPIIDKNGKRTTVHRRVDKASGADRSIPSVVKASKVKPMDFAKEGVLLPHESDTYWNRHLLVRKLCQDYGWDMVAFGPVGPDDKVIESALGKEGDWYEVAALTPEGALVNAKGIFNSIAELHGTIRGNIDRYPLQKIELDSIVYFEDMTKGWGDGRADIDIVSAKIHGAVTGQGGDEWMENVSDLDSITINGQRIAIGVDTHSNFACLQCGNLFQSGIKMNYNPQCQACGAISSRDDIEVVLKPESLPMLQDDKNVLEASWYHISIRKDWVTDLNSEEDKPVVHLGSKEAAMERMSDIGEDEMYLYEVKLNPGIPVAKHLEDDLNDYQPELVSQMEKSTVMEAEGANRYINRYEDAGSVSLMVSPDSFAVTKVELIGVEDK